MTPTTHATTPGHTRFNVTPPVLVCQLRQPGNAPLHPVHLRLVGGQLEVHDEVGRVASRRERALLRKHIIITRPSSSHRRPGAADLARGPAAPPACTACTLRVLSALPTRSPCRLPADSMRSPCTTRHDITCPPNDVWARWPPDLLRPCAHRLRHADERDPHFRPRRPCSHLRGARSDQDDQPAADETAPSHAGAHDDHRTLAPLEPRATRRTAPRPTVV